MRHRSPTLTLAVIGIALVGCGGDGGGAAEPPPDDQATQEQSSPQRDSATGTQSCDEIPVPGHEARNVRVQGGSCAQAAEIIGGAVGQGREAYEAAGFACEPSPVEGGDTDYTCTRGDARVTFRYGAA